jgi:hypothetical protein
MDLITRLSKLQYLGYATEEGIKLDDNEYFGFVLRLCSLHVLASRCPLPSLYAAH